jgi:hypothetical protein
MPCLNTLSTELICKIFESFHPSRNKGFPDNESRIANSFRRKGRSSGAEWWEAKAKWWDACRTFAYLADMSAFLSDHKAVSLRTIRG